MAELFLISLLFFNHFTFYLSYLGMNYSNVIGFLIFIVFLLQFISGLLLSAYYTPIIAFSSIYYIMIDVNGGWLIRFFHILGASMFMVLVVVHWIRGIWIKLRIVEQNKLNNISHRIKLNLIWVSGLVILLFTFLTSFIGYCVAERNERNETSLFDTSLFDSIRFDRAERNKTDQTKKLNNWFNNCRNNLLYIIGFFIIYI